MKKILVLGDEPRFEFIRSELERRRNMVFDAVDGRRKHDICILPLPLYRYPNIDYSQIFKSVKANCPILGGMVPDELQAIAKLHGTEILDYYTNELLMQKNAYLTSEGAVEIAIRETEHSIYSSKILITGYGRIATATARAFFALGADICIMARKQTDRESARFHGYNAISPEQLSDTLPQFDIIINTVPSIVIKTVDVLQIQPNKLYIELASKPGGIDKTAAKERGVRVIDAQSLPAATAPCTAALIILESIENILAERGKSL